MKSYHIIFDERAVTDLDNIFDYHAEFSLKTANKFIDRIGTGILRLTDFPYLGKDNGKYRRIVVKPYVVYYTLDDSEQKITILYVRHCLQEQP